MWCTYLSLEYGQMGFKITLVFHLWTQGALIPFLVGTDLVRALQLRKKNTYMKNKLLIDELTKEAQEAKDGPKSLT